MNLDDKISEFISRRFPHEDKWLNGNCYWFALILCEAFSLSLYYLEIENHFIAKDEATGHYYDWSGRIGLTEKPISWSDLSKRDDLLADRIIRDCVL